MIEVLVMFDFLLMRSTAKLQLKDLGSFQSSALSFEPGRGESCDVSGNLLVGIVFTVEVAAEVKGGSSASVGNSWARGFVLDDGVSLVGRSQDGLHEDLNNVTVLGILEEVSDGIAFSLVDWVAVSC